MIDVRRVERDDMMCERVKESADRKGVNCDDDDE